MGICKHTILDHAGIAFIINDANKLRNYAKKTGKRTGSTVTFQTPSCFLYLRSRRLAVINISFLCNIFPVLRVFADNV
jgi:hypothetical protein